MLVVRWLLIYVKCVGLKMNWRDGVLATTANLHV